MDAGRECAAEVSAEAISNRVLSPSPWRRLHSAWNKLRLHPSLRTDEEDNNQIVANQAAARCLETQVSFLGDFPPNGFLMHLPRAEPSVAGEHEDLADAGPPGIEPHTLLGQGRSKALTDTVQQRRQAG